MNPLNRKPRKNNAIAYIVNGFTAQLTNNVKPTGFGDFPALITSAKSILTIIGYIIKNRHIAIGIDTTGAPLTDIAMLSRAFASSGAIFPSSIPAMIHNPTHTVR